MSEDKKSGKVGRPRKPDDVALRENFQLAVTMKMKKALNKKGPNWCRKILGKALGR